MDVVSIDEPPPPRDDDIMVDDVKPASKPPPPPPSSTAASVTKSGSASLAYGPLDEIIEPAPLTPYWAAVSSRLLQLQKEHTMRFDASTKLGLKEKLWLTLDEPAHSRASFIYAQISLSTILISTITFCLESEYNCSTIDLHPKALDEDSCKRWELAWLWFEAVAVVFFTVELLLRFATCPRKRAFVRAAANWVDFLAILPFYLEQLAGDALAAFSVVRVIRLVRVFRVFKMGKSFTGLQLMAAALHDSLKVFLILAFLTVIGMILFSSAIFYLEADGDGVTIGPNGTPATFASIPRSFWWALVTLTTVGYGDFYPTTGLGKTLAVATFFIGIVILAMPITVIGDNFQRACDRQLFEDTVVELCTKTEPPEHEGDKEKKVVDLETLLSLLHDLDIRGNLRVARPTSTSELATMLSQYDGGGDGVKTMQIKEWRVFLRDVVVDACDSMSATVEKLARDVHNVHAEARDTRRQLLRAHDELKGIVRARAQRAKQRGGRSG